MEPAITILFDPDKQGVGVQLNPLQVKNWDFALSILGMAKLAAEDARRAQIMHGIQMQAAQAQQEAAVRKSLRL